MDYYENALDVHDAAEILYKNRKYRMSVFNSCLAVELYLKSKLQLVEHKSSLEASHDVINIYRNLLTRFPSSEDLTSAIILCRKYFNESRYPYGNADIFTNDLALEFLEYATAVKNYIENECSATLNDLQKKFKKDQS